jgi:hypothetical protein
LDADRRAFEIDISKVLSNFSTDSQAKARGTDLVEWNSAEH